MKRLTTTLALLFLLLADGVVFGRNYVTFDRGAGAVPQGVRADLGVGLVGIGTQRTVNATDDPNLSAINAKLTSTNDTEALTDYFDSTKQLMPLYSDDATLTLDNKGLANIMAALYDQGADTPAVLANVTNGVDAGGATCPAGTDFCYYIDMEGFRDGGLQFALDCDAGTVTATVECTVMNTGGAASSYVYHDVTNKTFGVANLQAAAGAASDVWIDNAGKLGQCKYVLVRIVAATGANTGDWRIDANTSAL